MPNGRRITAAEQLDW